MYLDIYANDFRQTSSGLLHRAWSQLLLPVEERFLVNLSTPLFVWEHYYSDNGKKT